MIKGLYYWSVLAAAVGVLLIAIIALIMGSHGVEPGWPLAITFVVLGLYVMIGCFIEGRDRE